MELPSSPNHQKPDASSTSVQSAVNVWKALPEIVQLQKTRRFCSSPLEVYQVFCSRHRPRLAQCVGRPPEWSRPGASRVSRQPRRRPGRKTKHPRRSRRKNEKEPHATALSNSVRCRVFVSREPRGRHRRFDEVCVRLSGVLPNRLCAGGMWTTALIADGARRARHLGGGLQGQ
jgi:hypothetical protein